MSGLDFTQRISFHEDGQIMEVDFSDLNFDETSTVHAFYDEVDRRIAETGKSWYFLVNYKNCRIDPKAWVAFAHRGKKVNLAHSLGSVRYMAQDSEKKKIEKSSDKEHFDANLFDSRDAAIARLQQMGAGASVMQH